MKFSALPVHVGDSFLLQVEDIVVLVDGGMNQQHILKLLHKEEIANNHIDLLICTHYDADHVNGIIGILKSQKYSFREIWLPEILGSLGYTLSKKLGKLLGYIRGGDYPNEAYEFNETSIFSRYDSKEIKENSSSNNSFENIDNDVLEAVVKNLFWWNPELFFYFNRNYRTSYYKMAANLKSVVSLISNSLSSGAYIRWFKYQDTDIHKSVGFNIYSENALQTDITLFSEQFFFQALYQITLSKINQYSLVYMYKNNDVPNVLFTADSDLMFYRNNVNLEDNSIVTAPHHGSIANDSAYAKIYGNNLIYVRSNRSQQCRPGPGYLANTNRYCTICRNITQKQKIELNLNGSKFVTNAQICKC